MRGAVLGHDLDASDDAGRLPLPWLAGQETAVNEDDVVFALVVGERHGVEIGPVAAAELSGRALG